MIHFLLLNKYFLLSKSYLNPFLDFVRRFLVHSELFEIPKLALILFQLSLKLCNRLSRFLVFLFEKLQRRDRTLKWEQCDQIWQNFTTLARCYKILAFLKWFIYYLAKFWTNFGIFYIVLVKSTVLQMANIEPINYPSGHTEWAQPLEGAFTGCFSILNGITISRWSEYRN